MAVPFSNTKLRVPRGFQNILEGLAREILRNEPTLRSQQPPKCIYEFGAKYFEQLLKVREETGHDPAVHGARLEDRFYNNDSFKSPSVDPNNPQQQSAATAIQTEYRRHSAKKEVEAKRQDAAATTIQAGVRGQQDRDAAKDEKPDINFEDEDVAAAATKIQAGFKGYKARKEIKESMTAQTTQQEEEKVDIDLNDPDVANAAVKIQAGFKGYKVRQEIKAQQETPKTEQQSTDKDTGKGDINLDDPETAEAALKIQAGFRGYKTRKEIQEKLGSEKAEEEKAGEGSAEKKDGDAKDSEQVDIDLEDPQVQEAATKIQAGFKGYKVRQEIKQQQQDKKGEGESPKEEEKPSGKEPVVADSEESVQAAVKIQAGYRGYKTRKDLKGKSDKS